MNLRPLPSIPLLLAALACGGGQPRAAAAPASATSQSLPAAQPGALARFAALKVMVLPLQSVRGESAPAWQSAMGSDSVVGRAVDRAVEKALGDRGLSSQWVFPPALERAARRNPTYVTDPYRLRAADAIRVALRRGSDPLAEPFSSQVRALAGVSDVRYALVPYELRPEPGEPSAPGQAPRVVLRVAMVDARGAQLVWAGEVAGTASSAWNVAMLTDLAQRVADLVVLR